ETAWLFRTAIDDVSALPSHAATPHLRHFYFAHRGTF
ncbi:MAG: hypothetical protein ACI9U6_003511, partial [Loktanella salsilacus]